MCIRDRSTAYGTITGWLTAIAGGILVLLAARRIWRRVRGEPAPLPELASTVPIPPVLAQPPAQQEPVPPAAVVAAPEDLATPMEQVAGERPPAPPSTPMR